MVVKQVAPRSYEVDLQGNIYRRNRRHLVKTQELPQPRPEPEIPSPATDKQPAVSEEARFGPHLVEQAGDSLSTPSKISFTSPVMHTRSGRTVRPPQRFQDCVSGLCVTVLGIHIITGRRVWRRRRGE